MIEQSVETVIQCLAVSLRASGALLASQPQPVDLYRVSGATMAQLVGALRTSWDALSRELRSQGVVHATSDGGLQALQEGLRLLEQGTERVLRVSSGWPTPPDDTIHHETGATYARHQ